MTQKAITEPDQDLWFWQNQVGHEMVQFCSHYTSLTPYWCPIHQQATSVPCPLQHTLSTEAYSMSQPGTSFLFELHFELKQATDWFWVDYKVCHPLGAVVEAKLRRDWRADGTPGEDMGLLVIRDKGLVSKQSIEKSVLVVRRPFGAGVQVIPIPDRAGPLVGSFASMNGKFQWFVFDMRPVAPPAAAASPRPDPSAPKAAPPDASSTPPLSASPPQPSPAAPAAPEPAPAASSPKDDWDL